MTAATTGSNEIQRVLRAWKQRDAPIKRLGTLLSHDRVPDILVYGPAGTGKTSIVRCSLPPRSRRPAGRCIAAHAPGCGSGHSPGSGVNQAPSTVTCAGT